MKRFLQQLIPGLDLSDEQPLKGVVLRTGSYWGELARHLFKIHDQTPLEVSIRLALGSEVFLENFIDLQLGLNDFINPPDHPINKLIITLCDFETPHQYKIQPLPER